MTEELSSKPGNKKSIAFITRAAPYGRGNSKLCLEMALACAVFEQEVNYIFLDDGVYQLLRNQNASDIDSNSLGDTLEALELYGIENVCVDENSLRKRNLKAEDLLDNIKLVDQNTISSLLTQSDCVFNL
ncbi:MAG: sulfurtransferase complex subunit TusC [SAR86 cluster bacterium]|uniref:Sulfurtransferase complex subunit TusC n=1 Tax=SAR86 cluster bacterium TaxID=2030880 RepID=A0A2A5B3Y4_9GAMM|nr:MAG: sulfurtransferase complex subunit TusC [SAR86 cluster bacterium]